MIYVITDRGVQSARTIKEFNRRYGVLLEKNELTPCGGDLVCKLTNSDIDFVADKARMSSIMFGNFFRKDNTGKLIGIVNLIITALILFTK